MQKLIIKNFRQIPYAEIDVTKFTIFIGPQASGKSTIAKLIYFFRQLPISFSSIVFTSSKMMSNNILEIYSDALKTLFSNFFLKNEHDPFSITYYYDTYKSIRYELIDKTLQIYFDEKFQEELLIKLSDNILEFKNSDFKINEVRKAGDHILARDLFNSIRDKVKIASETIFNQKTNKIAIIPSSRNIPTSRPELFGAFENFMALEDVEKSPTFLDDSILSAFLKFSKDVALAFHKSNPFLKEEKIGIDNFFIQKSDKILKAKIITTEEVEYITSNNIQTPLQVASTGQQEVIRILQHMYLTFEILNTLNVIEEPEAHLFPEAQKNLIQLMALMVNRTDSQIVITTHSPYILTVINDLLYYSKVLEGNPQSKEQIEEHFGTKLLNVDKNERINLFKEEVRVYSLGDPEKNYCEQVVDENAMISENFLDKTSEEIQADFEFLYSLHKVKVNL